MQLAANPPAWRRVDDKASQYGMRKRKGSWHLSCSGLDRERLHIQLNSSTERAGRHITLTGTRAHANQSEIPLVLNSASQNYMSVFSAAGLRRGCTCMCLTRGDMHLNIELEHMASEAASVRADTASEYLHGLSLPWREERGVPREKICAVT